VPLCSASSARRRRARSTTRPPRRGRRRRDGQGVRAGAPGGAARQLTALRETRLGTR
jgi:hypothetical protein